MQLQTRSGTAVELNESVFGVDFNQALIHQVVVSYLAGGRAGTKAQKSRSAVSGGGAKPFRQKGTGRARAGTIRSPLWRSGGVTFAATPRDHSQKVNKKMYRGAMRSIVSELVRQERLIIVDNFGVEAPKTKDMAAKLNEMDPGKALILAADNDDNLLLAARNLKNVRVHTAVAVDPVSLVGADKVIATVDALRKLEERLQ